MSSVWLAVVLAGLGTFAMRASFLAAADRFDDVAPRVRRVLRQIPPAALAALIVPSLVRPDGELALAPELPAGVIAALVAWRTRNVALTLVVGLGALVALRALGWS